MKNKKARNWTWRLASQTMYLEKGDKRKDDFVDYKRRNGFSPDELWNLDITIASFVLPRLKAFREVYTDDIAGDVDKAIPAFELLAREDHWFTKDEQAVVDEGLDAFRRSFQGLWY